MYILNEINFRRLYFNKIFSSDIGDGWGTAVLDTYEEYLLINHGVSSFINSVPFWTGGSTNSDQDESLQYNFDYMANDSGNIIR